MRYNILTPDGREIGYVTDTPEFQWALEEKAPFRKEIVNAINTSKEYQMVVTGGSDAAKDAVTPPEEEVEIDDSGRLIRLVSELPGEVPVQVEIANDMDKNHIAEELTNIAVKGRRYVSDPSEAPEGVEVQEGPQGGHYYETEGTESTDDTGDTERSSYTPAETPEEAVKFAEEHIAGGVDFEGMDLNAMNEVNEALFEFVQLDTMPTLKGVEFQPDGVNVSGAVASQAGEEIFLSKAFESAEDYNRSVESLTENFGNQKIDSIRGDIEYLQGNIKQMEERAEDEDDPDRAERMLENAERYREQLADRKEQLREQRESKADRPSATATLGDTIRHEYAHYLYKEFATTDIANSMIADNVFRGKAGIGATFNPHGKKKARAVSKYAASEPGEYLAESFVAYHRGEHDRLEDKVIEFWDTMLEKGPEGNWEEEYKRWV